MEGKERGSPPLPENALEKLLEKESYKPYKAFPNLFKGTHGGMWLPGSKVYPPRGLFGNSPEVNDGVDDAEGISRQEQRELSTGMAKGEIATAGRPPAWCQEMGFHVPLAPQGEHPAILSAPKGVDGSL